ncbi:MAG: hypothetical protein AB8B86_20155 [Pseudomonadales bacterium]
MVIKQLKFVRAPRLAISLTLGLVSNIAFGQINTSNYLSLENGTELVEISIAGQKLKVTPKQALQIIDGKNKAFTLNRKPGDAATLIEIVYKLPQPVRFHRFTVPNIWESYSQVHTFVQGIEVYGSADYEPGNIDYEGFARLAEHTLTPHTRKKQEATELSLRGSPAVQWIKVSLSGGIDITSGKMFFEFTELIGEGALGSVVSERQEDEAVNEPEEEASLSENVPQQSEQIEVRQELIILPAEDQ